MSALDRALIKAYRRQHGDASIAEPQSTFPSTVPDARSFHKAEQVVAGPHRRATPMTELEQPLAEQDATSGESWTTFRVDVGVVGLPSTPCYLSHNESETTPSEATPTAAAPAISPIVEPHFQRSPIVEEPAVPAAVHLTSRLLAPMAVEETSIVQPAQQAIPVPMLQPQLVVDRFDWPAICGHLCESAHEHWQAFLETLKGHTQCNRLIGFMGAESGIGCSTMLLCIARQLAASGKRVAIVDANFSNPGLAELLSVNVAVGWDAACAGKLSLDETLIESLDDHVTLAPLATWDIPGQAIAKTLHAPMLWRSLKESFDVVLFDAGSFDHSSCNALKVLCDSMPMHGMYLVCDCRSTTPQEIVGLARQFKEHGVNLLGAIENYSGTLAGKLSL